MCVNVDTGDASDASDANKWLHCVLQALGLEDAHEAADFAAEQGAFVNWNDDSLETRMPASGKNDGAVLSRGLSRNSSGCSTELTGERGGRA